ncbi:MAG: hypothetical protein ACYDHW_17525 [Syntrophorhabdaceae bacterium]
MWEEKEFLICVKTYPEYSITYTETVCTAVVLRETGRLIRLYPIPFRYLLGEHQFKKYQLVQAKIKKNPKDGRPESYRIQNDSIRPLGMVDTKNGWSVRKRLILSPNNLFGSLEDLQDSQLAQGTSLGIIKPMKIRGFEVQQKTESEIAEEKKKKKQILSQKSFLMDKKDLELIPYRFYISFNCDDPKCAGHKISILDWEFGELYRKVSRSDAWKEKMRQKVEQICSLEKDVYFFMGNMASRRQTFCILGIFYPPKVAEQPYLFKS